MKNLFNAAVFSTCTALCLCAKQPARIVVHADNPAALAVTVEPGCAYTAAGDKIVFGGGRVAFEPPEVRRETVTAPVPVLSYEPGWDKWQPWPLQAKAVVLKPSAATERNPFAGILGGLYHAVHPESVTVTDMRGKPFRPGIDYVVNPVWGMVAGIGTRLGMPGRDSVKASFTCTMQRIDLVEATPAGQLLVKKGRSAVVCPARPEPDPGCAPLAGVHIATFNNPGVSQGEICVIDPVPPVEPVNRAAVIRTVTRLKKGGTVRMAILGASTTHGAEAGRWWDDPSLAYRGRVLDGIRKRYPDATVEEISASQGGITSVAGLDSLTKTVLPAHPDLVALCFGGNDVSGPEGGPPNVAPEAYRHNLTEMVRAVKAAGAECILIGQYGHHPAFSYAARVPRYAEICREVAEAENVGFADVLTAWNNMCSDGIVPYSQLHNNHNHPGVYGHGVIAGVVMEFFK